MSSYYNALGSLASEKYHRLHINQLKAIYEITQDPYFLAFHERWQSYSWVPFFIREFIILPPDEIDVVIVAINILGTVGIIELGTSMFKKIKLRKRITNEKRQKENRHKGLHAGS